MLKMLNEEKSLYECPSESNFCTYKMRNSKKYLAVSYMLEAPYPRLLMYELSWTADENRAINTLQVIAALPPYFFLPTAYTVKRTRDEIESKCLYKLQSLICWNGRHYLTVMRVA